jgi:hypothetical protein
MEGRVKKTLMNLKMKLPDVGWKNMTCTNPHKDLLLLPQPHLHDKNLRAMLIGKVNKIIVLKTEKDNEADTQKSEFAGKRRHAGERQYHKELGEKVKCTETRGNRRWTERCSHHKGRVRLQQ